MWVVVTGQLVSVVVVTTVVRTSTVDPETIGVWGELGDEAGALLFW